MEKDPFQLGAFQAGKDLFCLFHLDFLDPLTADQARQTDDDLHDMVHTQGHEQEEAGQRDLQIPHTFGDDIGLGRIQRHNTLRRDGSDQSKQHSQQNTKALIQRNGLIHALPVLGAPEPAGQHPR